MRLHGAAGLIEVKRGREKAMAVIQDEKHKKDLVLRLRRVEGQLRGIQAMVEKGVDCERVTQQLSAARHALDKAFFKVLACALQSVPAAQGARGKASADERLAQAAELLAKFG
jgi:CsoR family transcriptional regulator, copper-sensing transcriptional repressor